MTLKLVVYNNKCQNIWGDYNLCTGHNSLVRNTFSLLFYILEVLKIYGLYIDIYQRIQCHLQD